MPENHRLLVVGMLSFAIFASGARSECPRADEILASLTQIDRSQTARVELFSDGISAQMYAKAAATPGRPFARRRGSRFAGVIVVGLPVEPLWKAVSDEEHFDEDNGYLPLAVSRLIDGEPRAVRRTLLQSFNKWGIGRWWVAEARSNAELFERSGGKLWEVRWREQTDRYDASQPPLRELAERFKKLPLNRGAWLLVPVASDCTIVEYVGHQEPGGFIGMMQWLLAKREVRRAMRGMVALATEHIPAVHGEDRFLRPDGSALD
ncbi:MAG: hypothetical protein JSV80_12175 [Acidobacteriota bacterium]|nr:MAG: hypothetical protein JSV80_12175 [Acidobacteriota bacterium]